MSSNSVKDLYLPEINREQLYRELEMLLSKLPEVPSPRLSSSNRFPVTNTLIGKHIQVQLAYDALTARVDLSIATATPTLIEHVKFRGKSVASLHIDEGDGDYRPSFQSPGLTVGMRIAVTGRGSTLIKGIRYINGRPGISIVEFLLNDLLGLEYRLLPE